TSSPAANARRTGVLRSATSDTRRTASRNGAVSTVAYDNDSDGSSERYFGKSPSRRREVVRRPLLASPTRPSPAAPADRASSTSPLIDLAVSASVFAGTSAFAE